MAIIANLPYNFTNGTTADASQVMQNFNQIANNVNANAAQLSLTPQLASENVFTQPQQMSDPTKPAHAVTLNYATSNLGFLGSANTWTKNNVFAGGIDDTVIGAATPAAGTFTSLKATGVSTVIQSVRQEDLALTSPENTSYQRIKITANSTRISALVRINFSVRSSSGISQGAGYGIYSIHREDGGAVVETLEINNPASGGGINVPEVSGNDVIWGFTTENNGTGTTLNIEASVITQSDSLPNLTTTALSGTTVAAKAAVLGQLYSANIVSVPGIKLNGGTTALNAYEEGTFTPTIAGSTTAGSNTYTIQQGTYTRVGRLVHVNIYLKLATKDATMAGNAIIGGLPYTSSANSNVFQGFSIGDSENITLDAGKTGITAYIAPGATYINLAEFASGAAYAALQPGAFAANSVLIISGTYNI